MSQIVKRANLEDGTVGGTGEGPHPRRLARLGTWLARLQWSLGGAGLVGIALLLGALGGAAWQWSQWRAWRSSQRAAPLTPRNPLTTGVAQQPASDSLSPNAPPHGPDRAVEPLWPQTSSVPVLLDRMSRLAAAQGIGWPRADYRYIAATAELPAALEVQCALKSSYPAIRRFVTEVLREWPSATLRELQLQRGGADLPEVEARITMVIFLADGSAAAPAIEDTRR